MSSESRPTTPNQPAPQQTVCPGAPTRPRSSLQISVEGVGRVLVFPGAPFNGAPDAPRAIPGAPKKALFTGSFTGPETTSKNIQF